MAQRGRRVVEDRRQACPQVWAVDVERRRLGRVGQCHDRRRGDLDAARRGRLGRGDAGHRDRRLLGQAFELGPYVRVADDDLGQAGGVAQDQERDSLEQPAAVHPAGEAYGLADVQG
jgi:hypothetical protein